jgi:hypothetical protein
MSENFHESFGSIVDNYSGFAGNTFGMDHAVMMQITEDGVGHQSFHMSGAYDYQIGEL